jgi:hypothetical protein
MLVQFFRVSFCKVLHEIFIPALLGKGIFCEIEWIFLGEGEITIPQK